jgi:hypothetical protein
MMMNKDTVRKLTRAILLAAIVYFGFVFPDSLSDHTKLVHFCAHMGMSFFLASCLYIICNIFLRMRRSVSVIILTVITLVIGACYKYFEISGEGLLHAYDNLGDLLRYTGCYTSMSQNTAGLLAAILLIEYTVANLPFSPARSSRRAPAP